MPDQWKSIRIKAPVYDQINALAGAADRSLAGYVDALLQAALKRQAGRVPYALNTLRAAAAEAEAKGAVQAASILNDVIEREAS